jgi:demethoxyubiquinone hydroxylase (CLK1/Coq7/Cat5 family)
MLRCVAPVRPDVSEGRIASIIRVTRIGELGALAVSSNRITLRRNTVNALPRPLILVNLMMEAISSSETSILTNVSSRGASVTG